MSFGNVLVPSFVLLDYAVLQTGAILMIMYPFPLKEKAYIHIPLGGVIIYASLILGGSTYEFVHSSGTNNIALNILLLAFVHFVIYVGICVAVCLSFNANRFAVLFNCIAGYAIKLLSENVFYFIELIHPEQSSAYVFANFSLASVMRYELFKFSVFAVCYLIIYLVLFRNLLEKQSCNEQINYTAFFVSLATITVCHFLNLVRLHYSDQFELNIVAMIFSLFCCLLVILIKVGFLEQDELKVEIAAMQKVWNEQEKQAAFFKENVDNLNMKYHDLKRSIMLLQAGNHEADAQKLLDDIDEKLRAYDAQTNSGNPMLDTILTQYRLLGDSHHIRFTCFADGSCLKFISDTDLAVLLGNILENSVDAVKNLPSDKRLMSVSIKTTKGMPSIHIENPFDGKIIMADGLPVSTKKDTVLHGFGTKSIVAITKKYGGIISFNTDDGIFKLNILFPPTKI